MEQWERQIREVRIFAGGTCPYTKEDAEALREQAERLIEVAQIIERATAMTEQ